LAEILNIERQKLSIVVAAAGARGARGAGGGGVQKRVRPRRL